jgi:hypothetical protein
MTEQKLEAALNKEMFFIVLRWKIRQHHPDKTKNAQYSASFSIKRRINDDKGVK